MKNHRKGQGITILLIVMPLVLLPGCTLGQSRNEIGLINGILNDYHNRASGRYSFEAYYYEHAMLNGETASFSEAHGYFFSFGNNFYIQLNSLVFFPENMRRINASLPWQKVVEQAVEKMAGIGPDSRSGFKPEHNLLLNAFRRLEVFGPLNRANLNDYQFQVIERRDGVVQIDIRPTTPMPFEGKIFLNREKTRIDSLFFTRTQWFSQQHQRNVSGWLKVHFRHEGRTTTPVLLKGGYSSDNITLEVFMVATNGVDTHRRLNAEFMDALIVYSTNPIVLHNGAEWAQKASLVPRSAARIIRRIGLDTINQQLRNQIGKPFYTYILAGREYPDIEKLKRNRALITHKISRLR